MDSPCRVRKFYVRGLQHTRPEVVQRELTGLTEARSLQAICENADTAVRVLQSLDIFEAADVLVDKAPSDGPDGPLADVIIRVKEKKRLASAGTGVSTQGGEGSMDAKLSVRNLLGWAERYELNMEYGQQKSSSFRLSASRPRLLGTDAHLTADVTKAATSYVKHSSFVEKALGGSVGCRVGEAHGAHGGHHFSAETTLRDICQLERGVVSWHVLQQRGLSLKNAIRSARAPFFSLSFVS